MSIMVGYWDPEKNDRALQKQIDELTEMNQDQTQNLLDLYDEVNAFEDLAIQFVLNTNDSIENSEDAIVSVLEKLEKLEEETDLEIDDVKEDIELVKDEIDTRMDAFEIKFTKTYRRLLNIEQLIESNSKLYLFLFIVLFVFDICNLIF